MKIVNMRKDKKGAIRAYFDLEHPPFVIMGFKLMESDSGLWVSLPKRSYKQGSETRWAPTADLLDHNDTKTKELLSAMARDEYLGVK